jgi:uncharacterized protein (DUF39 family)
VTYAELRSGSILVQGKKIPTASLSSYARAREIADTLKRWIEQGSFLLTKPAEMLPSVESGIRLKTLKERPVVNGGAQ